MPFHVEVRSSLRRARRFNLAEDELRRGVLAPWAAGATFDFAEGAWDPHESSLRIIEGPPLAPAELAHGQGWSRAERTGRDVTRELVGHGAGTVVAATRAGHDLGVRLLRELGLAPVDWGAVRAALVAGAPSGIDAVLVMAHGDEGPWLFDAGLAIGALGRRALVVAIGPGAPARLGGVDVLPAEAVALRRSLGPG
jgi:hypothetical protein